MRLDLSHANLQPLDFSTPSTLPALLNHYFAPLQPYQAIAASLYGTDIVEQTGEVEYPLWQIRQAYLATIRWHQAFDKALETVSRSSHTVKSDEEATQAAVELAIAKVLKQTLTHPKEGLNDYSGCSDPLDTLITWVTQITPHQQVPPHHADNLIYALSLLITLGLRDSTQGSLRRHILSFLKGEKVTLSFKVKNSTHTTTELTLNPKLIMRDLMFIDFRYTYWSTLNLDGIEFSGADFTGAFFVGSQNLTKARYCCFYKIHDERLHLKKSADLEGTQASPDVQSKQHRKHYFWGLSNLHQASLETDNSEKKKKLTQAAQLLKTTKKAFFHKSFIFKMHLASLALLRNRHKEAIHLLLTAWNLDAQALNSIVHSKPHHPPPYLNLLGWDVFKEHLKKVITRQQLRSFYIQLSEKPLTKNHRQNNTHKTMQSNASILEYATSPVEDSQRQRYLTFIQALWPEQTTLYEDLCNYPNPYGYRQSERSAYETLVASIQRLCLTPQSDDNKSLDTEHVNQDKTLPCIELRCHSVGNQRLLPSIVQELVEHKLLDINKGKFKPPQKKKTKQQTEDIRSQHRVIRIDCDAHGVYLSSEPDVPRHAGTLGPGYVSLHLKIHPDLPMMDYTTDIFNRRLIGHGSPANEFVVLTVIQEATGNQSAYRKRYPVLISQTVEGMNLKHVLANHPEQLECLDNKSTSEFFIAEVLKHPGDGFSRNYVIKQQSPTTTQIVSIDNGQMFIEPIVKTSAHSRQKHKELQERSIIYCLPPITQTPLDERALNTITAIRDVTKLLTAWLNTVEAREAHYTAFLTKEDIKQWNAQRKKNNPFIPHALFRTGAISLLAMQLRYLQSLFRFREQRSKKIIIKPTLVIKKLNPRLLHYYKAMSEESGHQALTSEAAFKKATGAVQSMSSSEAARAILGDVPDRASIQQQFNQLKETAKMSSLVHKAQDELNYLGEQLLADLKGKQAFNITDEGDWELRVDFQPPREKLSKKRSSVRRRKHAHKAETSNKADKVKTQSVTAKLQNLTLGQKEWLNTLLVKRATFKTLVLSHCIGLDDPTLVDLIRNSQRLAYLDITGCQQITQESLRELANHCKELRILKASRTGIVDATRETGLFQFSRLLHFPKLNKLHLSDCAQKKVNQPIIHLTRIALDAPELETLKSSHNTSLRSVELPNAIHLTDLNLENNAQLTQLKTPAEAKLITLNIADCKQLTEEQLTFDSRLLKSVDLTGCDGLMHRDFRTKYPTFLTALDWSSRTNQFVENLTTTIQEIQIQYPITWQQLPSELRETLYQRICSSRGIRNFDHDDLLMILKNSRADDPYISKVVIQALPTFKVTIDKVIPASLEALQNRYPDNPQAAAQVFAKHLQYDPKKIISELLNVLDNQRTLIHKPLTIKSIFAFFFLLPLCMLFRTPLSLMINCIIAMSFDYTLSTLDFRARKKHQREVYQLVVLILAQLVKHDSANIILALSKVLDHLNPDIRQAAAPALAQCVEYDHETVISALKKASRDSNPLVRQAAVPTLAQCVKYDHETVISTLKKASKDLNPLVRQAAAPALAQCVEYDSETVISILKEASKDLNPLVRQAAAPALAQCVKHNHESVISALLLNSNDSEDEMVLLAQNKDIDPRLVISQLIIKWNHSNPYTCQVVAQTLVNLLKYDSERIISFFINLLKKPHLNVCQAIIYTLTQCVKSQPNSIRSTFINALKNSNPNVRKVIVQALTHSIEYAPEKILSALINALKNSNPNVRKVIVQALTHSIEYAPEKILSALINALKDPNSADIHEAITCALVQCVKSHPTYGIPTLLHVLNDSDKSISLTVRQSVVEILAQNHSLLRPFISSVTPTLINAWQYNKEKYTHWQNFHHQISQVSQVSEELIISTTKLLMWVFIIHSISIFTEPLLKLPLKYLINHFPLLQPLRQYRNYLFWHEDPSVSDAEIMDRIFEGNIFPTYDPPHLYPIIISLSIPIYLILNFSKSMSTDSITLFRQAVLQTLNKLVEFDPPDIKDTLLQALNNNHLETRQTAVQAFDAYIKYNLDETLPTLLNTLDRTPYAARVLGKYCSHLETDSSTIISKLLKISRNKASVTEPVFLEARLALATISSTETLQSWIKKIFEVASRKDLLTKFNLNLQKTHTSYSSLYPTRTTQQTSTMHSELPGSYSNSQEDPEEEENEQQTSNTTYHRSSL